MTEYCRSGVHCKKIFPGGSVTFGPISRNITLHLGGKSMKTYIY
jgi:hypothetical protein